MHMLRRSRAIQTLILFQTASVMMCNPAHNDPDQMSHDTANMIALPNTAIIQEPKIHIKWAQKYLH